ncbi:hypothetical protein ACOMHN_062881 [Nucella lapillus]
MEKTEGMRDVTKGKYDVGKRHLVIAMSTMKSISWKAILTSFPVWALFLAAFARDSMLVVLTAIMPQYYSDVYSMNPAYVGLCSTLPPLGMSVMIVVGGVASDFLLKRGIKKTALRKLLVCFGGVIQGLCIGALYFTDRWRLAVALFSVASFGGFATAGYPPMFYDMAPKYTSVLADLAQSGFVGGILTSVLAAQLPGKSRSLSTWQTFYLIVGLVQFLIALLFFLMADSTRQPWADSDVTSTTSSLRPSEGRDVTSSHRSPGDGISQGDLYDVLGVRKGASTQEIKSAYKKMAREWHPDKNKAPDATDRFTKINEAYETLSDDQKRRDYDNFGYTTAQERPQRHQPDFGGFPFGDFFNDQGFTFGGFGGGFGRQAESVIDKHMTTLRNFETKLQPESHHRPCFLYAFGNFCFNCMRMEHIIEKFFEELESVGLCIATIHIQRNPNLASHLRVYNVPALMGLVDGRLSHFKSDMISLQGLREFVRQLFPKNTLLRVKDSDVDTFLDGWRNNQMTAIFFSPRLEPSARFMAPAFYHRDRIVFAFVSTSMDEAQETMRRFNVNKRRETFLMFNEETSSPVATISMQQLSRSTLEEVITSNRFLLLPRLSSQSFFDELCPREPKIKRRRLCVALITNKIADHDVAREKFRQFAQEVGSSLNPERLQFVYLYEEVQQKVMQVLTKGNSTRKNTILEVVIIWHQDQRRVSYEFLEQGWSLKEDGMEASRLALKKRLTDLLQSDHLLPYKAVMPDFYNEHALHLLTRMLYKVLDWADRLWFFFAGYHPQTYFMTVMAVVMASIMGFIIKRMNDAEEAQVRRQMKTMYKQPRPPSSTRDNQTIHLYELRYESFSNLVKEADTGLTIVVLVDEESKAQLLHAFAQIMQPYSSPPPGNFSHTFAEIMQPYSRYSALTFGFLQLEYYISWYQSLLEQTLSYRIKLDTINIRNCIGTVLALNGYRKYYYIYHPRNAQRWMRKQNRLGQAMGFMDSDSESDEAADSQDKPETDEKIFLNEVLSGLNLWMDRVFDGSVRKVRIEYWPEMVM